MELIVVDLTGPMSVPTWSGMLYTLVVIEVSCHFPVRHLLRLKDEAARALQEIVAILE
jgi:hypothetical protein